MSSYRLGDLAKRCVTKLFELCSFCIAGPISLSGVSCINLPVWWALVRVLSIFPRLQIASLSNDKRSRRDNVSFPL